MEDVRSRRVIDNNGIANGPSELRQILDVVSSMIIARFTEEAVFDNMMNVQMVQHRIGILEEPKHACLAKFLGPIGNASGLTFDRLAVKTTTSYSSPIRFMNASTPGRFIT